MVDHADDDRAPEPKLFRLRRRSRGLSPWAPRRVSYRLRRFCLGVVALAISLCLFAAIGAGFFFMRLSHGPVILGLEGPITSALAGRLQHGLQLAVGGTDLEANDGHPALVLRALTVKDASGRSIMNAPKAAVSVDLLQLAQGQIVPTRLDIRDLTLKLSVLPDGTIAVSAGADQTALRLADAFAGGPSTESPAPTPHPAGGGNPTPASGVSALQRAARNLATAIDRFTGADAALGGFDRLSITGGTLEVDDRTSHTTTTFKNLDIAFDKLTDGASKLTVSADGAEGRWTVDLRAARHADQRRSMAIDIENITVDDLLIVPGFRDLGFDADMPFSANLNVGLDALGGLSVARGRIAGGSGLFRLHDPDHEPVLVDEVNSTFHLDSATQRIVIDPSEIKTDTSSYHFSGEISQPDAHAGAWSVSAKANGLFGAERPGEAPIVLDKIVLEAQALPDQRRLTIKTFSIIGPQISFEVHAELQSGPDGNIVKASGSTGKMPAQVALRLWPNMIAAEVRAWMLANLQGGTVDHGTFSMALDDADFAKIKAQKSVADSHLKLDYSASDISLAFMDGVPPLHALNGAGVVTGDTSKFLVSRGLMDVSGGKALALIDGSVMVPTTEPKPTPATITAHFAGGLDTLTDLLSRDALKSYAGVPADAPSAKGQVDGTLVVALKLGKHTSSDDVKISANAQIAGLAIDKLIGKQGLTDGAIAVVVDKSGLHAKGDARLFDAPVNIDLKRPSGATTGEANLLLTWDDAARAKAGLNLGKTLTGPITAKITSPLGAPDKKASVEIDLTKAAVNNMLPGLSKAAGKPGKASFVASQRDNGVDIDNISCDVGPFSLRGSADLDASGGFQAAHMTQVRFSPGDEMKADVSQGADGLKIDVRGANIDARPFLKAMTGPDTGGSTDPAVKDLDLDLHAGVLTGQNNQVLTSVDLRMERRGGQIKRIQLAGRFGRSAVTVTSAPQGNVLTVGVISADAGASLAFLDLYKRVSGGKLETAIRILDGRMDGYATIHDFSLREDPAMKKLTEESMTQAKTGDVHIDSSNIEFSKLFINFSKTGSRIDVKDGAMFNAQMGATVQGTIDFTRDRIALNGTFVPVYGVNNLFSQIPLVGPILGGGAHEGLFGLNYKITGPVGTPNLSVDPLSALAPGFLRKIFGAISNATEQDGAPTPQSTVPTMDYQAR